MPRILRNRRRALALAALLVLWAAALYGAAITRRNVVASRIEVDERVFAADVRFSYADLLYEKLVVVWLGLLVTQLLILYFVMDKKIPVRVGLALSFALSSLATADTWWTSVRLVEHIRAAPSAVVVVPTGTSFALVEEVVARFPAKAYVESEDTSGCTVWLYPCLTKQVVASIAAALKDAVGEAQVSGG